MIPALEDRLIAAGLPGYSALWPKWQVVFSLLQRPQGATVQEITETLGCSRVQAQGYVRTVRRKGYPVTMRKRVLHLPAGDL
jgi:biotin operon repressor